MIQRTVHRVLKATSNWLAFDQALEVNETCWNKNQYPEEWSSKIVNQTLEKIKNGDKDRLRTSPEEHQKNRTRSHNKPTIFQQYIGNLTQNFASKLKKLCEVQLVFITRKLGSCLITLKSAFDRDLKPHVVYKIKFYGC